MAAVVDMTIVAESSPVEICHDLANDKLEKVFLAIEEAAVRRALEEESSVSTVRTQQKSLDEKMERKVIIEEKPVELSPTASTSDEYVAPLDANASSNAIQAKKYRRRTSICVSRVGTVRLAFLSSVYLTDALMSAVRRPFFRSRHEQFY